MIIGLDSSNRNITVIFYAVNQFCLAMCDVVADAIVVERTECKNHKVASRLQILANCSSYFSSIVGLLATTIQTKRDILKGGKIAFYSYAILFVMIPILGCFLKESKQNKESSLSIMNVIKLTIKTFCYKKIFYPILFLFLLAFTPTTSEAFDYYLIYYLKFTPVEIGYLKIAGGFSFMIALFIIGILSRKDSFNMRRIFAFWTILSCIIPFLTLILVFRINKQIGLPDFLFVMTDRILIKISQDMVTMCTLILTARLCPPKIEAVFATIFQSANNFGSFIGYQWSKWLTNLMDIKCIESAVNSNDVECNFNKLWLMIVICNLTTLIPLILIKQIPDEKEFKFINDNILNNVDENENIIDKNKDEDMIVCYTWFFKYIYNKCKCLHDNKTSVDDYEYNTNVEMR